MSAIKLTTDQSIAVLTIDVPTIDLQCKAELATTIEQVVADPAITAVILTSAKPGRFVGGLDVHELDAACDRGISAVQARDLSRDLQRLVRRIETSGKPFAAAMNGAALDAGFEITLGCHYRVLADDAQVGLTQAKQGLMPSAGGTQRLPRLIGLARALPLLLSGNTLRAREALQLGIVHAVVPADRVVESARDWLRSKPEPVQPWDKKNFVVPGGTGPLASGAQQLFMIGTAQVRKQTQGHLPAPRFILSAVYEGTIASVDAGLAIEAKYFGKLLADPVTGNLLRTSFNKERASGQHCPQHIPSAPVRKLGVLGAGMMGSGIAYVAAEAGIRVVLLDTTLDAAKRGKSYAQKILNKAVERATITSARADAVLENINTTTDYAALDGCDLVIEAVFENRAIKREVMQRAEAVVGQNAVLASNTSTLPITGLAAATRRPAQFIGLHFFSPVDRMPLLEIIRGRDTSDATLAKALDLAAQLRKTPIVVNDSPGFYTTRVFSTFIDEGLCMLAEGVEPALIENAAKLAGMPVGPLAQFDEVSLELSWSIVQQACADGLPERFTRAAAAPYIEKMMQLGRKGRRHGAGFYDYPADGKKVLWPGLAAHFPAKPRQPSADELQLRFLTIQALEAARCMEEGVITDAADADVGGVLGIGYPQWTGGPLSYIDMIGAATFVANSERFAAAYGARYAPSQWLKARAQQRLRLTANS